MNIVVDYGNTAAKVGIFEKDVLVGKEHFPDTAGLQHFLEQHPADHILVSSVSHPSTEVLSWAIARGKKLALSADLPLPIRLLYATPHTLGVDRIAAVCGALDLFPLQNRLIIDAGTCVNMEFLDQDDQYHGGSISPGMAMRFDAMHRLTARLPKVKPVQDTPLVGNSTETCLQSGVVNGLRAELNGLIERYAAQYPGLQVILCGGDASFFESHLKPSIFVAPDLVLKGLNRILKFHVSP